MAPTADNAVGSRWYTIGSQGFAPAGEDVNNNGSLDTGEDLNGSGALEIEQRLQIVGMVDGAPWTITPAFPAGIWQAQPDVAPPALYNSTLSDTVPVPYLMRLSPQELPDTEPINLPPGMVVDLASSRVPPAWYTFEDTNQNGQLDPNEDDGNTSLPNDNGNGVLDDVTFDIPVSPNGTITGPLTGSGPIYLYLCPRDDVDRMRAMLSTANGGVYGVNYAAGLIPGDFENGSVAPYGPDHPSSERKIVCIIPQTGLVYIAAVNGVDANNDGWADDPYSLAREGREDR